MKKKGLSLNQKIAFIRKAEKFRLTLSTVQNLMAAVIPKLEEMEEFEVILELKAIETVIAENKLLKEAMLIKNSGLSTKSLKKALDL